MQYSETFVNTASDNVDLYKWKWYNKATKHRKDGTL